MGRKAHVVLQSGREWDRLPSAKPVRGGEVPPTSPPRIDSTCTRKAAALALNGTFEHSLDAKNRLTVPAKFRGALSEGVYLVRSPDDPCVQVYPAGAYASMADQAVAGMNPMSRQAKEMRRLMFTFADDVTLDGAGRITLTARHLQHAGIDGRDIVITGTGDALELWSPAGWADYERGLLERAPELTGSLDHPA